MTMSAKPDGIVERPVCRWSADCTPGQQHTEPVLDSIAQECAVALVYNGVSHVVMMASPTLLTEFAIGFSFTEAIVNKVSDIFDVQIHKHPIGFEVALTISSECFSRLKHRRRLISGRTGCGVCGQQSLEHMQPDILPVSADSSVSHQAIDIALQNFTKHQPLQHLTGAVHGAAWCESDGNISLVAEDIGRHNALDKLIGLRLQAGDIQNGGFLLISSRASFEIIQKSARANIAIVVALSAPTSLAVSLANQSRQTLVGFARKERHVVYTETQRIFL